MDEATTIWPVILALGSAGFWVGAGVEAAGAAGVGAEGAAGAFGRGGTPDALPASSCFEQPSAAITTARTICIARGFVMRRNLTHSGIVPRHGIPRRRARRSVDDRAGDR